MNSGLYKTLWQELHFIHNPSGTRLALDEDGRKRGEKILLYQLMIMLLQHGLLRSVGNKSVLVFQDRNLHLLENIEYI